MQPSSVRAVITGGVSGLGLAVASRIVADGGQAALFDVNDDKGAAAIAGLGDAQARYLRTDVTSEQDVAANIAAAADAMGGLNVAVNCAGIIGAGRVLGRESPMPLAQFQGTVMVNLVGSFNVAKAAAAVMQHNEAGEDGERGVIVNTASAAAFDGQVGQEAYSASKGGLAAMTLPLARDLSQFGVRACTIAPGLFLTPLLAELPQPVQESLAASIPFPKRLGKPEEFGHLAASIVENLSLNGEVIRLDGALRMAAR